VVTCSAIEWFRHFGEFAVSTRKPIFVRWAEEAEAKQVCLIGRARAQRGAHEQPSSPAALLAGLGFVAISRCSGFGSHAGPMVRILFPPPGESVSPVPYRATGARGPAFAGSVSLDETREQDVQASRPPGNHWNGFVADSPLEGNGFELSVPR
jgi:hypothetical protein